MGKFYIYRYFNHKNQVIYVGLTARPLKQRVKEHSVERLQADTHHIDFATVSSEADMRMYELYYINKYRPKYNKRDLYYDGHSLDLPELVFEPYLEDASRCDYNSSVEHRDYTFNCKGGTITFSLLNPYDKNPDTITMAITGRPELTRSGMQELIKLAFEAYDDLPKPAII